jgi:ABC-type multidrug transport system fused ATPase/permease subunit
MYKVFYKTTRTESSHYATKQCNESRPLYIITLYYIYYIIFNIIYHNVSYIIYYIIFIQANSLRKQRSRRMKSNKISFSESTKHSYLIQKLTLCVATCEVPTVSANSLNWMHNTEIIAAINSKCVFVFSPIYHSVAYSLLPEKVSTN